jgi:hypothetical protein
MARRLALLLLCLAALAPSAFRRLAGGSGQARACPQPEGRGGGDQTWIGCATDPGPRRALTGQERVLFGMTVDVNHASAEDLAAVPGFTRRIAAELVRERTAGGAFTSMETLLRVRGLGPARLARARSHLALGP